MRKSSVVDRIEDNFIALQTIGQRDDRGGGMGGGDFRGGENIVFAQNPNAPGFGSRTTVEREKLTSGRGAGRNRRPIPSEVVPTKPKTFMNKKGN